MLSLVLSVTSVVFKSELNFLMDCDITLLALLSMKENLGMLHVEGLEVRGEDFEQ